MSEDVKPEESVPPPPTDVAGLEALDNEPDEPVLDVRGRSFRLRTAIPSMLIGRMARTSEDIRGLVGREYKTYTPSEQKRVQTMLAAGYDSLVKLVVEDERSEFVEYCIDVEPPLADKEQGELLSKAIETVSGRPTVAS